MSARDALLKFSRRHQGLKRKTKKKNNSPEKAVEKEVMAVCMALGFDVSVIESKAVYSEAAGRYLSGQVEPGFSDITGCDSEGFAVYIELKAKGRVKNVSKAQGLFLRRKINKGAFAVVVDSGEMLSLFYQKWVILRRIQAADAKIFLEGLLPELEGIDLGGELF